MRGHVAERRVAVTGIGVVSALGTDVDTFWSGLLHRPALGDQVVDWDPTLWMSRIEARHTDRFAQFAVAAAALAAREAKIDDADPVRVGVMIATALGGVCSSETQTLVAEERGDRRVSPYLIPMMMPNAAAAAVSMAQGWRGPCEAVLTACAAGTHAISHAARLIARGTCDVVLAGGAEAGHTRTVAAAFANMRALSRSRSLRPFAHDRDGFVMAEGAAVLVLESWDRATARGAHIHGEILGSASTSDGHDLTAPRPDGSSAAACIDLALADAGIRQDQVGHINAHGTGTKLNDAAEFAAIASVFGTTPPPTTSVKGATGHAFGASGAFEAVAALLAMRHGVIPPTLGCATVDPAVHLDIVREPGGRPWRPGPVVSNSFGFGGHNGVLVLGPAAEPPSDD
jgi:3-oxoacyl-[acyl-carrier-protein] synthase II